MSITTSASLWLSMNSQRTTTGTPTFSHIKIGSNNRQSAGIMEPARCKVGLTKCSHLIGIQMEHQKTTTDMATDGAENMQLFRLW